MLKAKKIEAITLELTDGVQAVLVQEGAPWHGLVAYRCIAPGAFKDQLLIAMPDQTPGLTRVFHTIFGQIVENDIVAASPSLGATIKAINFAISADGAAERAKEPQQ
ncbi:hypothetical protein SNE35_22730 [Paucibacter sp. R3-3]|uniref:Uncharacterized protein n=1 Tax=Roseateles agri TaxID=3098619 RepID=A0ABU5DM11_9BURK|nr:hypothetical protein [Paucibacter sp. R3-3]MDY0747336.1 hypothetical protein [Paucibacter sp. R3-3]